MSDAEGYNAIGEVEVEAAASGARDRLMMRLRWPLIIGVPVVVIAVALFFFLTSGRFETTDNAYVQIGKAPVSASVGGRVTRVFVTENQTVRAGQPLFSLDARDFQVNLDQAEAQLAQAELQVRSLRAAYDQQAARVAAAQDTVAYTAKEAARQQAMLAAGVVSAQQAAEAAHAASQAREQLAVARQEAAVALANLGGTAGLGVGQHPSVLAARAQVERARLSQSYAVVAAPADGVVTRVNQLQPGAYVTPSQTVFWLLTGAPWVEANFKEDQLHGMRIGQRVEITVDAYKGQKLTGYIASFSPGTGAIFSALPAQNATGNWVKVSQRLPVRIAFDKAPPEMAGRAGLSAEVKVDLKAPARRVAG